MITLFKIINVGDHGLVPGPEVCWMRDFDKWYRLYFYSFLIKSDEEYILINTGLPDDLRLRNEFLANWAKSDRCKFSVVEKIENVLNKIGLSTDDISHVIITPIQDYTIGRINLFKKAMIYFSKKGWFSDVVNPSPSPFLNRDIYLPKYIRNYLFEEAWNRIRLLDDNDRVKELEVKWTGCHHRSSLTIKFNFENKTFCISDSAFLMGNYELNIPIGIAEDIYECLDAYEYMKKHCDFVIPAYDPDNLKRYEKYVLK